MATRPLLLDLMQAWVDDDATRQRVFVDNPEKLYDFRRASA